MILVYHSTHTIGSVFLKIISVSVVSCCHFTDKPQSKTENNRIKINFLKYFINFNSWNIRRLLMKIYFLKDWDLNHFTSTIYCGYSPLYLPPLPLSLLYNE